MIETLAKLKEVLIGHSKIKYYIMILVGIILMYAGTNGGVSDTSVGGDFESTSSAQYGDTTEHSVVVTDVNGVSGNFTINNK